ncbi:MAG: 3-hydroxyacyl-CoA dehydrogenase/enoyl-CoA hydratase family protein [Candidatus Baldrarchaeia archaeon]
MKVEDIKKIAVIGAGIMGHGIAQIAAMAGYEVHLVDIKQEILEKALEKIKWSLSKFVEKGRISKGAADAAFSRIKTFLDLKEAVKDVDFVIEAVVEDINVKKQVFKTCDEATPPHTILATNTSTLPITEIAEATKRPDKVIGMHYFNPPQLMPLVEVIRGDKTSDETTKVTVDLAKKFGKEVVICKKDVPGFIVNRLLGPILQEAAWMVHRGEASVVEIDSAVIYKVGLPMGIFELADFSGIDTIYKASLAVRERDPRATPICPVFEEYYKKGWYGQKSGRGFYEYKGEKWERPVIPKEAGEKIDPIQIFAPAINAAAWMIRNDVASVEDIDKAVKLGLGYPKGLLEMADEWGIDKVVEVLREKQKKYPEFKDYYEPDSLLVEMVNKGETGVKAGKGFYEYKKEELAFKTIILRKEPPLAWIILNRPQRLNAISPEMVEELDKALDALWGDKEVRVLIITGAGDRAFCAGADVTSFVGATPATVIDFVMKLHMVLDKIERFPKPVIAAINGFALGGGCEIAIACDFRIASDRAQIGQPEILLGLIPGAGGTQRLVRLVGLGKAKEIVMLGDRIPADEAQKIGLVNKVVPADKFEEEVRSFASRLAEYPPIALKMAKYATTFGSQVPLSIGGLLEMGLFSLLFSTKDFMEGVSAFLSKRKPKFKGE